MGKYREFGRVWRSMNGEGIGKFLVVQGVGSSMGGIWKEWGNVGRNEEVCWGVGEVSRMWGSMG